MPTVFPINWLSLQIRLLVIFTITNADMKKIFITAFIGATALCSSAGVNSHGSDGYHQRGILMYRDQNYTGCIDQMTNLKALSPTGEEAEDADFYIAMSNARLGKADAVALLKYFLWRYPQSPRCPAAMLAIGNLRMDAESYGEAIEIFDCIDVDALDSSSSEELRYNLGFCLLKRGELDRALPLFQSLSGSKRYSSGARFYEGYIAYSKGDYRRAADLLKDADRSKAPGNMADYYLSQIYFLDRDFSRASSSAKHLMDLDVDSRFKTEATRIAGESQYNLGNDAEAVTLLRRYVSEAENPLPSAMYILGVADYRLGDYENAIARLTPVTDQKNAMGQSAYLFIGQALMQQSNWSAAMIAFENAYKMDYDRDVKETAFYNYAVARTEGGKVPFGSSVNTFEDFLRRFPDSRYAPKIREYIVTGYMTDNNYPAALASIESISRPSEKILKAKQQVLYTLGSRELSTGETASAIKHLRQAQGLRLYNAAIGAETDLWLGEALYADGQYDAAAQALNSAIANRSLSAANRPIAIYDLGYARFSAKNYDEALSEFNRFVNSSTGVSSEMVADAYNRVGDCHYYNSDFSSASDAYQKSYSVNPGAGDYALFQSALMKGLSHDRNGKIAGLKAMIQRFPSSGLVPSALLEIGETYDEAGSPDMTIETYSMLASRYPATQQGRQANLRMALAYLNNDNRDAAITTYKDLISSAPTSDEARQASENLKNIMAESGSLNEYAEFINSVPGATPVKEDEMERLAFRSAERDYLSNGTTARLTEYLDRYPSGESRPEALACAIRANRASGNNDDALKYATEMVTTYPDNPLAPEALKAKADVELIQGKGMLALESYTRLEETASSPYMVSEARLGIIRTARDLGMNDRVIEAADRLLSSSTISAADRNEAKFARAHATALSGDTASAASQWRDMASNLDDINGTKAAFYLAQQEFDLGDLDAARKDTESLINSDTPHNYWLARAFILLSDINRAQGNTFEAEQYLQSLRENYPGSESDIFNMISERLQK